MKRLWLVLLAVGLAAGIKTPPAHFAVIGDRTGGHQEGVYERVVAEVAAAKPEVVFTVGDQIEGYTEDTAVLSAEWREYRQLVAPLSMPLYLVPGNHDITTDGQLASYRQYAGEPYYSVDHQGVHFVVLDNSRWNAGAQLPAEQLAWLDADLAAAKRARHTVVLLHKPFWENELFRGKPDTLHALFVKHGVDAVFAGHYHVYFTGERDGIRYTSVMSSGGEASVGPTGIQYGWVDAIARHDGISITPVLAGGERRAWEDVTVADLRSIERNEQSGIAFPQSVPVTPAMTVDGPVFVAITNPSDSAVADTLRWDLPEGWSVEPAAAAVTIPAQGTVELLFAAKSARPFPAPTAQVRLPYAPGKSSVVGRALRIGRSARCVRTGQRPVIDGNLTEKCWQSPERRFIGPDGGPAATDSCRFYFAHDDSNLYLGAVLFDRAVVDVKAQAEVRDGAVYNDDCVGWFLQPDVPAGDIFQVYFNPAGVGFDQRIAAGGGADPKWDGEYEVKTAFGKGLWTVEARVPYSTFDARPGPVWGVNFRRKQPGKKANADWQPVSYDPNGLGRLEFE